MDSLGLLGGRRQLMLGGVRRPTFGSDLVPSFSAPLTTGLGAAAWGSGTPTFTRATVAYVQDWEGLLKPVLSGEARFTGARRVRNKVTVSNPAAHGVSGYAVLAGATYTAGYSDPWGGTSAARLVLDATAVANTVGYYWAGTWTESDGGPPASGYVRASLWIRADSALNISLAGGRSSNNPLTTSTIAITSSWQRFSLLMQLDASYTSGTHAIFSPQIFNLNDSTARTIYVAGFMLENVTGQSNQNPSEYVSAGVLSAPYHGANVDGVKYFDTLNGNTVASNVVTEATGAKIMTGAAGVSSLTVDAGGPFGYFAEGARSDVLGTTNAIRRDMSSASWVATSITKSTGTGADGTASAAARLTASGANGTALFTTVLAAAVRTYSAWVRRVTGSGTINMTVDNGVSWTPITLTTAYQQFQVTTANVANPIIGFQIVTSGDAIEVDFNQLEVAAFASSPIDVASATRNADVLTYTSAGNWSDTVGSFYYEVYNAAWANLGTQFAFTVNGGTGSPGQLISATLTGIQLFDGTNTSNGPVGTPSGLVKQAASFGGSSMKAFANGSAGAGGSFDGAMNAGANMGINHLVGGAAQPFGTVRNLRIYNRALSDAQLQAMTA